MARATPRGFTLLEVMVAIAILGLSLAVILSSQVGLFSSVQRTQNLTLAVGLARCRMSEVEVDLLEKGFQLLDVIEDGPCCEDEEDSTFNCEWKIERVELPEMTDLATLAGEDTDSGGSGDAITQLMELKDKGKEGFSTMGGTGVPDLASLTSAFGSDPSASMQGIAASLMGLVYPNLKPMLEASIRRVTITVRWREGSRDRTLAVTQFVTRPQEGLDPTAEAQLDAILGEQDAASGTPGTSATSRTKGSKK
jgi:general secretion pathway protein I